MKYLISLKKNNYVKFQDLKVQAPETRGIKKQALLMFSAIQYAFLFGMIFLPYASDVLAVVLPVVLPVSV